MVALDHCAVGRLQMAGKGLAIEERSREVVLLQVLAERLAALRIVRQFDRPKESA